MTSMCLTFANPVRSRTPLAVVASSSRAMPIDPPRSSQRAFVPRPSKVPRTTPYNSLSAELVAITACAFDHVLMQRLPRDMVPPDALLRALRHPAKSASVRTVNSPDTSAVHLQISANAAKSPEGSRCGLAHFCASLFYCEDAIWSVSGQVLTTSDSSAVSGDVLPLQWDVSLVILLINS